MHKHCLPAMTALALACAPSELPGPTPAVATQMPSPTASKTPEQDTSQTEAAPGQARQPLQPEQPASPATLSPNTPADEPSAKNLPKQNSAIKHRTVVDPKTDPGLAEFVQAIPGKGALWAGNLAGNGGRSVLVYIPEKPDNAADVRLIYHFHGTYSEHIEAKAPGVPKKRWVGSNRLQQTIEAITEVQQKNPTNAVLIYPLSAGKRQDPDHKGWWNGAYDRLWMADIPGGTDSFEKLHAEVLDVLTTKLGVHPTRILPKVIAEGHSAGGIALRNVAESGTTHVGEYIFLDASFQSWSDRCYTAVQQGDAKATLTLVITDKGIADPFGKRDPWCAILETDDQQWDKHGTFCQGNPEATPAASKKTCEALKLADEEWDEYQSWCTAMKMDMQQLNGVYVHRTKVPHGEQPRRFSGGLELPSDRAAKAG